MSEVIAAPPVVSPEATLARPMFGHADDMQVTKFDLSEFAF